MVNKFATPIPALPEIVKSTPATALESREPASRSAIAKPGSYALVNDPGDLVERALAILDEENDAWQSRRSTTPVPSDSPQSPDERPGADPS